MMGNLVNHIKRLWQTVAFTALISATSVTPINAANPLNTRRVLQEKAQKTQLKYTRIIEFEESIDSYSKDRYELFKIPFEEYEKFKDTGKPNALVIFPTDDYNGAFEEEEDIQFIADLRERYDTRVRWCSTENEVYKLLEETPNIELLILSGHGAPDVLCLGSDVGAYLSGKETDEKYALDLGDKELKKHTKNLKDCVTVLLSCSNGRWGAEKNNVANSIYSWLGGRVISSKEPFAMVDVKIISWYPMKMIIRSPENTYVIGKVPKDNRPYFYNKETIKLYKE